MFTGVTPFSDGTNEQVLNNISNLDFKCPLEIPPLAKDLISLMLERNHQKRYTAKDIKEHRWIKEFTPRKGTLVQQLKPTLIKDEKFRTGAHSTKSQNQLLNPSPRELTNSVAFSFRRSITSMKNQILNKANGMKSTKTLVIKHKDMLSEKMQMLRELEKKVDDKKNKFNEIISSEKLLSAKIKDIDYDILRIVNICEVGALKQKTLDLREEANQKSKECEIQNEILKNLRQKVKINTISIIEKEEELRDLVKSISGLKEQLIKEHKENELQIYELFEFIDILKKKINNSKNPSPLIGIDQKISEEIVSFISTYMDKNPDDLVFSLRRLIMNTDTKARSTEKLFFSMKIEYSEEREKIISLIKKKKDHFFSMLRRKEHGDIQKKIQENRDKEHNIINSIEQSRMKENEHCAEALDIAIARNKLYVIIIKALKKEIQECEYKIGKNKILRADMAEIMRKNNKKIERSLNL